jgi:POT family proton-dependent oligopeptide transporter
MIQQIKTETNRHPKGLFVLFFTEMWERFSYYGMRAILVLYVTNGLQLSDKYANADVYGSYTGLVYLTPLLGGYFADRIWGNRRSIITGGFMMAAGQFLMFISASMVEQQATANILMWCGLLLIIIGNGFFKPNISSMVGQLYPRSDNRLDAAYTIFYMGINLGAFIAPLVCGGLGEQYNEEGNPVRNAFRWGFMAACIAMLIGTIFFIWLKNKYVVDPSGNQIGVLPNKIEEHKITTRKESTGTSLSSIALWTAVGIAFLLVFRHLVELDWIGCFIFSVAIGVCGLIITDRTLTRRERARVIVIFISAFFVIFFWAAFEQAGSSLVLFAERDTDRSVAITTQLGNVVVGMLLLAALLYLVLNRLMQIPRELNRSFAMLGAGALVYAIYCYANGFQINMTEIPASWFNSLSGLFIILLAPIMSMLWIGLGKRRLEPSSPKKQSIGLLALAAGYLIIAFGVKGDVQKASTIWLFALYFFHSIGELSVSPIGLSLVNKLAPARFASILMGVWFLSNATANKFAGILGALYPGSGSTRVAGYQINDLYDFFMLFVIMSSAAAILLFFLSFWMEKHMTENGRQ